MMQQAFSYLFLLLIVLFIAYGIGRFFGLGVKRSLSTRKGEIKE